MSGHIGDRHLLGSDAFRDADGPLAAHSGAGCRELPEDVTGRDVGRVELVLETEAEAEVAGFGAGLLQGEAGEVGNLHLAAMNGKAHGDEGREQGDSKHCHCGEEDVEEALHQLC